MRLRVVWGFEVTIATFCPTSLFTSVDFPAFGRPTMATNPERKLFFSGSTVLDTGHPFLQVCASLPLISFYCPTSARGNLTVSWERPSFACESVPATLFFG